MFIVLLVIGLWKLVLFMCFLIMINFLVILFVVFFGFYFMDISNWEIFEKFVFYGFDGIMIGVLLFYFVFFGFDIINFVSEEINNFK